jgi:hypothetical protein
MENGQEREPPVNADNWPMRITNYNYAVTRLIGSLAAVTACVFVGRVAADSDAMPILVVLTAVILAVILGASFWSVFRAAWAVIVGEDGIGISFLFRRRFVPWDQVEWVEVGHEKTYVDKVGSWALFSPFPFDIPLFRYRALRIHLTTGRRLVVLLSRLEHESLAGPEGLPRRCPIAPAEAASPEA